MKIVKIDTNKNKEEIFDAFMPYLESEKHNAFSLYDVFFNDFSSCRTGIHSYLNYDKEKINGYYETGEIHSSFRGSSESLFWAKTWFSLSIKQTEGVTKIRGLIFHSPWLTIILALCTVLYAYFVMTDFDVFNGCAGIVLLSLAFAVTHIGTLKEQKYIYNLICRVCK